MFETKNYLNITNIDYKINNNEFIILQSLLTNEYFNDLIPFQMNEYITNINYDLSKPDMLVQKYSDEVPLSEQIDNISTEKETDQLYIQCIDKIGNIYGNALNIWKKRFPKLKNKKEIKEIYFNNNYACSFYVLIYILQLKINTQLNTNTQLSVANLKQTLWLAYSPYIQNYSIKIFNILKKQGKKNIIERIEKGYVDFQTLLFSEEYYLTDLDIWIIANHLKIPIVLFSLDDFKTMINDINWLVLSGDIDKDDYYFIRSPKLLKTNTPPNYSLIDTSLKLYELKGLDGIIQNMVSGSNDYKNHFISFDSFIQNYVIS